MKRRREHGECETKPGGRGCLVLGTAVCEVRREKMASEVFKRRLGGMLREPTMIWWLLVGILGVAIAVLGGWAMLQMQSVETMHVEAATNV